MASIASAGHASAAGIKDGGLSKDPSRGANKSPDKGSTPGGGLKLKKKSPLPDIPDQDFNTPPIQEDLSPIEEVPARKPIRSQLGTYTGSSQITGYAGVFIP